MKLRRFWIAFAGACLLIIAIFIGFEELGIALSFDTEPVTGQRAVLSATLGLGLLVVDVLLPVPSSIVMIAHGTLFGVIPGAFLSILGCIGAAAFGCALGRLGQSAFRRFISAEEHDRARALLERWGLLAVAATRPVPVLAEAVAIIAGATGYSIGRTAVSAAFGSAPAAFIYAWAGARRLSTTADTLIFALVLIVSLGFWLLGRERKVTRTS